MSGKMVSIRIWTMNKATGSSTNLTHIYLEETMFPVLFNLIVSMCNYCLCGGLNENSPMGS